jgi:NADP-reducing hydrogenase subunit HndB
MVERIKSPKDLAALREKTRSELDLRTGPKDVRVTVHMGTCGIAAGAADVLLRLMDEVERAKLRNVTIQRSGCAGLCQQEPMMTVVDGAGRTVCYGLLDADKVRLIVTEHIVGGNPVAEFVVNA